ncbi:aromatic amino acid aminotransferase apoenzyme [Roseovarius nanhaiticus]|uniref:Aminotransferase n=1 Tax=Roseovarius nanhaiticus TaxID=573024 RepID=A0A1N7H3X6_9RHOB|nr:amino acid aminotransferase [Roseovarius nanhaiticus]SEL14043.1 aromatic amino acid aminotransferase apoenzyme [Roseovarius nanhaiticus]SIS19555.1 aromatic amino acid aminotransferase apoenzyme [Roseovarius nanhaiticus]
MLEYLPEQSPDGILQLMQQLRADPRPHTVDLGVGVYRDASGNTPVMRAVRQAQERLNSTETTKTYTALEGDSAFLSAMQTLVLDDERGAHIAAIATPGGTGAVRLGFDLVRMAWPDARVFHTDPTWANHLSILAYLGMEAVPFRYFDAASHGIDMDGMLQDLAQLREGDVVLLHGCCHNPTGADLNATGWQALIRAINAAGAVPMIDLAYLGLGDGIDADAAGLRAVCAACPEVLIAVSCSKNFGLYRERVGALLVQAPDARAQRLAQGAMTHLNRQTYSFPPDHGARLAQMVLDDPALCRDWQDELAEMRGQITALRGALAAALRARSNSDRFDFITAHRGMFSMIGASPAQVTQLREDHGIYMTRDARINIAGLGVDDVPHLARAMLDVGL